jgi:hypothetical protein
VSECLRLIDEGVARHKGTTPVHTAVIGPRRFEVLVASLRRLRPRTAESLERFRPYVPYTQVVTRFQNVEEAAMLQEEDVSQPVYADYFPRIVRYALEHDFGKPTRRRKAGRLENEECQKAARTPQGPSAVTSAISLAR